MKSKISKTKNNRLIMYSKCALCGIKKTRFVKEQEAPLNKIPLLGDIFF